MYTVDASVWVSAFDQREPGHQVSRQFLEVVRGQAVPIIVPNLVLVEVAGAISRTRQAPEPAQAFALALSRLPHVTVRALDEGSALHALTLAARHGLRGADAVYATVAHEAGSTLVTLDNEHLTRLVNLITVCTPAVALATLIPPLSPLHNASAQGLRSQMTSAQVAVLAEQGLAADALQRPLAPASRRS